MVTTPASIQYRWSPSLSISDTHRWETSLEESPRRDVSPPPSAASISPSVPQGTMTGLSLAFFIYTGGGRPDSSMGVGFLSRVGQYG